jgi:cytochrome c553
MRSRALLTRFLAVVGGLCVAVAAPGAFAAGEDPQGVEFFEKHIRPVLVAQCYQCHSASAKEIKGELRLDTREGLRKGGESGVVVVPGKPDESLLMKALRHEDGLEMPPNGKLPDGVIANFEKWIAMGAPDPRRPNVTTVGSKINIVEARKYWAFQPPKLQPPGPIQNTAWPRSEIDRYLLAAMEAKGVVPVADADRRTLIRRVYFDLIGLPPPPEEVEQFVQDTDPKALEKLIDRLLAMPQFGERWGRHWLDVARYGESTSKERNYPYPYAWRYRDYVYDSFAQDKPYDQFIREQIAGDLLPAKNAAQRNEFVTATGFLAIGPKSLNTRNREQYRMDVADEQLDVATRAVLALSVACARCHDHKFDPIPTADYYAMVGIFRSTEVLDGLRPGNNRTGYEGEFGHLVSTSASGSGSARSGASAAERKQLAQLKVELERAREELQKLRVAARENAASGNAASKAGKKAKAGSLSPKQQQEARQLQQRIAELTRRIDELESKGQNGSGSDSGAGSQGDLVMAVRDAAAPEDCRIHIRGEVTELGDVVPRGYVRVLTFPQSPDVNPKQSGRLQLAMWMTSRQNPLTARVMVNRIWYHLLGRGIVPTVDNFGALGEPPSHPELLDYLALQFMEQGWSVKKMIRQIMLSRAYQLSSDHHEGNYQKDPDNILVWRMNRRRLEAEAIRDAILAIGGNLDLTRPKGSPVQELSGEIGRRAKTESLLRENRYRSAYLPIVRGLVPEVLNLFDGADPELVTGQRDVTTVAPQALYLMNAPLVLEQAEAAARRLLADRRLKDDAARLRHAFLLVLGRLPTPQQQDDALAFLSDFAQSMPRGTSPDQRQVEAWASLCQALIASAEFRYLY